MKKFYLAILCTCTVFAANASSDVKTISECINNFYDGYQKLKSIKYLHLTTNVGENTTDTLHVYFEKNPSDTIIGIKFEAVFPDIRTIYNGNEILNIGLQPTTTYLDKDEYERLSVSRQFLPVMGYADSYPNFAQMLKIVLEDTTVVKTLARDTVVDGYSCQRIKMHFRNKRIYGNRLYTWPADVIKIDFDYTFYIDKTSYLLRRVDLSSLIEGDQGSNYIEQYVGYKIDEPMQNVRWELKDYPNLRKYVRIEYVPVKKGEQMPNFTAHTLEGKSIDRSYFLGKTTVVFFWGLHCGASQTANKVINSIAKKHPDANVVGLINWGSDEAIQKYVEKEQLEFPVAVGSKEAAIAFGINGFPYVMVFDKNGVLQQYIEGYSTNLEEQVDKAIQKANTGS